MRRRPAQRPSSSQTERVGDGETRFAGRHVLSPTEATVYQETSGGPVKESAVPERSGTAVNLHGLGGEYLAPRAVLRSAIVWGADGA